MEEFERNFSIKCDSILDKTSFSVNENETMIKLISDIIKITEIALKTLPNSKRKKLNSLKHIYISQKRLCSLSVYIDFFIIDLMIALKHLCLNESNLEKAYFIKQAYASISEFIVRIKDNDSDLIKDDINKLGKTVFHYYENMISELESFSVTDSFRTMELVRNKIANHYDADVQLYIKLLKELDELKAVKEITNVFFFVKSCREFNDELMKILSEEVEKNNFRLKEINA